MTAGQIILYGVIALIVFLFVRRRLAARKIKQYRADEAKQRLKSGPNVIMLDVRTDNERKSGKIRGSFHIPLHSLTHKLDELKKFRDKEIICYCRSGNRSLSAAIKLNKAGFNAANLRGGFNKWN